MLTIHLFVFMPKFDLTFIKSKHFLALVGNGIISVFSLVNMSLIYRCMEKERVGSWFFFLAATGLADAARHGFLGTATIKFYAGTGEKRAKEVLGSVWFLATAITILLSMLSLPLIPYWKGYASNPSLPVTVHWFALTCLSSLPFTVTFWILVADERYIPILYLRMVNSGSMFLSIATVAYFGKMDIHKLCLINFATNCLTSFVCIVLGFAKVNAFPKRTWATIREIADFGKFSLATNLSTNLLGSVDTFILNTFVGPAAVAIYSIPSKLMEFVEIPLRSFIGTGMSGMAIAYNKGDIDGVSYIFKKYAGMLTWAFVPMTIGALFFAEFAISLLGGGKYVGTEAPQIYRMFMLMALLFPIDRFNGVTLDIINKPQANFKKVIVMLIATVITDLIGIYITHRSIYGVAFASPLTLIAGLIMGAFALKKEIKYTFLEVFTIGFNECWRIAKERFLNKVFKKA